MTLNEFGNLRVGDVIYFFHLRREDSLPCKSYWVVVEAGARELRKPHYSHRVEFIWSEDNLTPLNQIAVAHDFPCWFFHAGL